MSTIIYSYHSHFDEFRANRGSGSKNIFHNRLTEPRLSYTMSLKCLWTYVFTIISQPFWRVWVKKSQHWADLSCTRRRRPI